MADNNWVNISALNVNENISEQEFITIIKNKTQQILDKVFSDYSERNKRIIKQSSSTLNFACPYCRDSAFNSRKKRGNIILKGKFAGYYKCFNCGKFIKLDKFFRDFENGLDLTTINYISNHYKDNDETIRTTQTDLTTDIFNTEEILKYAIDKKALIKLLNLSIIDKDHQNEGYRYLVSRCQFGFENFLYDGQNKALYILNFCDKEKTKVIGYQARDLTGQRKNKYKTVINSRIHQLLLKDNVVVPPEIDTLSTIFNIFTVDAYRPILVTEGPFDAFLLPNCIATSGASKSINLNLNLYFVYDSDKTGTEYALKRLNNGNYVFMWDKLKQDYKLPERPKWDINDFFIYIRNNNLPQVRYWSKYFTNDILDTLFI